ncbi:hypothetical protein TcWFU_003679 [Taenia crassiceps]|uniref:Ig-like domain-containing protein n=1 Tax=Taenia crassiceps TaxID=6207 RepID=A0ABR4QJY8_9CEST
MAVTIVFFLALLLRPSLADVNVLYYEADEYVIIEGDWSVWFIPRLGVRIKSVKWEYRQGAIIDCHYTGPDNLPMAERFFTCLSGCKYAECGPESSFGLRVDGSIFSLYAFHVTPDMVGEYALSVKCFGNDEVFKKTSTLALAAPPVLLESTLTCNVPQIARALQSTLATVLEESKLAQVYAALERQVEGTEISGSVEFNRGIPRGNAEVCLIRYPRHRSYPYFVPCESRYKLNIIEFSCLIGIEDVGLAIMAFNTLNSSHTTDRAKEHLKDWILKQFASWLLKIFPTNLGSLSGEFGTDYRVIPLKIGWPAVVHIGQNVRIFCPLEVSASPDGIECKRTKFLSSTSAEPLPAGFWVEAKSGQNFFNLRKKAAELTDSGVYECTVKVDGVCLQVCTDRRLTVIADSVNVQTFIYGRLVPARLIKAGDIHNQYTESLHPYLMTNQVGYIVCWTNTEAGLNFSVSLTLTREDPKPRHNFPFKLVRTLNLREGMYRIQKFKFYQYGGYGKAEYGGKLSAICSVTSNAKKNVPAWAKDKDDLKENFELGHIASSNREILVFHGVVGNLSFHSRVRQLEEHPVPLGTSIRCTGAKGFPPPTYQWTKVDPSRLMPLSSTTYFHLAGTPNVFLDSPDAFPNSAFQGDRLVVPNDFRFRGMSFLFQCRAFNEVVGKTYLVERLLFLTICLCEHRFVSLDLSLIYSPQMVAGHTLLDPRGAESSLDFYGQRYVHLLQQIILGLSHGADYVRISTNPTSILNTILKKALLYASSKSLTHGLSRFQLAEGLFSKSVRPQPIYHANNTSCPRKIPVDLTEGFLSVYKNAPNMRANGLQVDRPHVVVLPRDRWDKGDVVGFMQLMKRNNVHVISVYFENPSGWVKDIPDRPVQLTGSDAFGEKCSDHFTEQNDTFIRRIPLFDEICNLSRPADVYDRNFVGFGFLSHSQNFMFEGERIIFFTVIRGSPFSKEPRYLRACFVNRTVTVSATEGFENQKYFDSKCKKVLGDSAFSGPGSACLSMSRRLKLNTSHDGDAILVYERGVNTILSQSGYITIEIRLNQQGLRAPYLLVNQLARKANDSAEFECVIEMTRSSYQIDLVYWSNSSSSYLVVVRTNSSQQGFRYRDIGRKVSARLIWPAFPKEAENSDIYCVLSHPKLLQKRLATLPSHSSNSVRILLTSSCPTRPVIKRVVSAPFADDLDTPRLGARMSFFCEAVAGEQQSYSLQMAFADRSESFVICSETRGGSVNTTVPCHFTTWEDGGCRSSSKTRSITHPKAAFAKCGLFYVSEGNVYTRVIEYTIPLVTIEHFDAFVFCEILPSWEVDEENRLLSDPIDNLFPVKPTLTNVDIGYYKWLCGVIAYPPPTKFDWRIKEAHPWSFRLGLNRISFEKIPTKSTRASVLSESRPEFFPKKFIPKDESSPYYFVLSRAAPSFWQVGSWGVAKLECEVSNGEGDVVVKEVHVNYASGNSNGRWTAPGLLYPRSGVANTSEPWAIECPIGEIENSRKILNLYLLGKVAFSAEPVELPLFYVSLQMQNEEGKAHYVVRHSKPIGWWGSSPLDEFQVEIVDDSQGHKAVRTQISRTSIADTGCYVCRLYLFGGYNDADVQPELIVMPSREPPLFAHKLASKAWTLVNSYPKPLTLFEGDRLEARCLTWYTKYPVTSPSNVKPSIFMFALQNSQITQVSRKNLHVDQRKIFGYYNYYLLEHSWYVKAHRDGMKYVGCYWGLQTTERSLGIKFGPLRVCGLGSELKVAPEVDKPLKRSATLICYNDGTAYEKSTIQWIYKIGPLPRPRDLIETQQFKEMMPSPELKLSNLPSPGFYVYTCRATSKCGGRDMISEKDVQFMVLADENSTLFTTVRISPQMVLIPGKVNVECPSLLTENSGLIAKSLQWFRLYRQGNMISPESDPFAHQLSYHDLINGTVTVNHPNLIAYQHQQVRDLIFAIDITPSSFNDFGYYGCAFSASKTFGGSNDLVLSQVSAQPVCLIRNVTGTTIRLSPFRAEACYHVGEFLSVECEAMAYQALCVEDDKPLGVGLLSTVATLNISNVANVTTKVLRISSSIITGANPPKKLVYFSPVLLNISSSHNDAILTCEVRPKINKNLYNFSTDWAKLQLQLIRRATAKICVSFAPSNLIINPPPPDQVNKKDVAFVLKSGEWVTCLASGNPAPWVTLDAYPLRKGTLPEVMRLGLSGIRRWRDPERLQPNWPTAVMQNDTGSMMLVKKELDDPEGLVYVGVCRASNVINGKEKAAHKLFVFRIGDTITDTTEGSSFYHFMAVGFFTAVLGFILTTFIREIVILRRRSRRTSPKSEENKKEGGH